MESQNNPISKNNYTNVWTFVFIEENVKAGCTLTVIKKHRFMEYVGNRVKSAIVHTFSEKSEHLMGKKTFKTNILKLKRKKNTENWGYCIVDVHLLKQFDENCL